MNNSSSTCATPRPTPSFETMTIVPGLRFRTAEDNKLAIEAYLLSGGRGMVASPNNSGVQKTFFCNGRKLVDGNNVGCACLFRSYRQKDGDFKVTSIFDEHIVGCTGRAVRPSAKVLKLVASAAVRADPNMKSTSLRNSIVKLTGAQVSRRQANRVKSSVARDTAAENVEGFQLIGSYLRLLSASSPGTITALEKEGDSEVFKRCFVMSGRAANVVMNSVPNVLSLDAVRLTEGWNGTVLTLTGKDSNNKTVLISTAICDKESTDNLQFLLQKSKKNAPFAAYMNDAGTTVFTGCHESFADALRWEVPLAQRRLCLHDILKNIKPAIGQALKQDVFKASRAPTVAGFDDKMASVKRTRPDCVANLKNIPTELWTDYAGPKTAVTCGQVTSNLAESSMSIISPEVRRMPPYRIVKSVIEMVGTELHQASRVRLGQPDVHTPYADFLYEEQRRLSAMFCVSNLHDVFMVKKVGPNERNERVRLRFGEGDEPHLLQCSCEFPLRHKLPCCHALAVCQDQELVDRGRDLIDKGYSVDLYRALNADAKFPIIPPVWSMLERDESILPPLRVERAESPALQSHSEGTALQSHAEGPALQSHAEGTALQSHSEGPALQSHAEGPALQSHAEGTALQAHAEGTALQSHAEGTALQSHAEGTARLMVDLSKTGSASNEPRATKKIKSSVERAESPALQSHSEGPALQSHSEGTAFQSHAEGTGLHPHAEGTALQSHAEGTARLVVDLSKTGSASNEPRATKKMKSSVEHNMSGNLDPPAINLSLARSSQPAPTPYPCACSSLNSGEASPAFSQGQSLGESRGR